MKRRKPKRRKRGTIEKKEKRNQKLNREETHREEKEEIPKRRNIRKIIETMEKTTHREELEEKSYGRKS